MVRRPTRSTRTDTLLSDYTLFRSARVLTVTRLRSTRTGIGVGLKAKPRKTRLVELQLESHIGARTREARVIEIAVVKTGEVIDENDVGDFHRRHRHRRADRSAEGVGLGPHSDRKSTRQHSSH